MVGGVGQNREKKGGGGGIIGTRPFLIFWCQSGNFRSRGSKIDPKNRFCRVEIRVLAILKVKKSFSELFQSYFRVVLRVLSNCFLP